MGEPNPEASVERWLLPFFMESVRLPLAIAMACVCVDSHVLHPLVDPLTSEAPSAAHLGGRNLSALCKPIYLILAQLKVLGDLLESHPSVLHSGAHLVISLHSKYQLRIIVRMLRSQGHRR